MKHRCRCDIPFFGGLFAEHTAVVDVQCPSFCKSSFWRTWRIKPILKPPIWVDVNSIAFGKSTSQRNYPKQHTPEIG